MSHPLVSCACSTVWVVAGMCDAWCLEGKPANPSLGREQMLCWGNGSGVRTGGICGSAVRTPDCAPGTQQGGNTLSVNPGRKTLQHGRI